MPNFSASTNPPAKLNLFLEIPAKRDDGFHEIDTVMVAIDWRDELCVKSILPPVVQLSCQWLPSMESVADELGLDISRGVPPMLDLPTDSNLVTVALEKFRDTFEISSGFDVRLNKRIPAGAGMGGASSDAAHALRCAAQIHQIPILSNELRKVAASVGSDVPFFLEHGEIEEQSMAETRPSTAARARGRGEILSHLEACPSLDFVVAFPNAALSTGEVYRRLCVPDHPQDAEPFVAALERGERENMIQNMFNRLSEPALEMVPRLKEIIESMRQSGLEACQLTGSGSACFGIAENADHASDIVNCLRVDMKGVLFRATHNVSATAPIELKTC